MIFRCVCNNRMCAFFGEEHEFEPPRLAAHIVSDVHPLCTGCGEEMVIIERRLFWPMTKDVWPPKDVPPSVPVKQTFERDDREDMGR
jgi:hypothetical protein